MTVIININIIIMIAVNAPDWEPETFDRRSNSTYLLFIIL